MIRHIPALLLCVPVLAGAAACGDSQPPAAATAAVAASNEPLVYQPADREEVQIILLSLLQKGRDECLEMAAARRRFLQGASSYSEQTKLMPHFEASDAYVQGLRGQALVKTASQLFAKSTFRSLLSNEDRSAMAKSISSLERLCAMTVAGFQTDWDGRVRASLTEYEIGTSQLSEYPVAAALQGEMLDLHASLVDANFKHLAGRREAEARAEDLWEERTDTAAKSREQYEREKEEYRQWLAEQEKRRAERRRWQNERQAALAEAQQGRSSAAGPTLRTTGPDPAELIAMRQWHDEYRIGIRAFRATLIDYEDTANGDATPSYRTEVCQRMAAAARQTLDEPGVLTSPNPTVARELTEAVRDFAEAAEQCTAQNREAEERAARSGREHFRLAGEALDPYGLSI